MTKSTIAALKRAGVEVGKLEVKEPRVKTLPAHCVLDPAGAHGGARFEVAIPGFHPTRLNVLKGCHWGKAGRMKRSDAEVIGGTLKKAGVTGAIGRRRMGLVIVLGPGQRGGDPDAYDKSARDALKRCGALKDDNRQWLEPLPTRYERSSTRSTRIILEDI